jgi:hypothetical protein
MSGDQVVAALGGDAEAVGGDEVRGIIFSTLATLASGAMPIFHLYGLFEARTIGRHHRVVALERELDRGLADRVGLLDVGLGGDVARGALQVVGHAPVVLEAEALLDDRAMTGATPPSWAWPKASRRPWSARNLPSALFTPSETTTVQ